MKIVLPLLCVVVLLLCGVLFFEHTNNRVMEAKLATLTEERDVTQKEMKKLGDLVTELRRAPVTTASSSGTASPAPRVTPSAIATAASAEVTVPPGVIAKAPQGWHANGTNTKAYLAGVDTQTTWGGMPSAYVQSTTAGEKDFGGMMQTIAADNYAGKRVRLSGWVKTEDANDGGGHLWLRVDGQERGQVLQFDNMGNRAVKGTADWQEASVVLDVPANAAALAYGFFVQGGGKMWVNGQKIEEVGQDVASTNMVRPNGQPTNLPKTPTNLGFYPDPVK